MTRRTPVVSTIFGGLGNQMFQYAAGRALAVRLGLPLAVDISWFLTERLTMARAYGLGPFSLPITTIGNGPTAQRSPKLLERLGQRLLGSEPSPSKPSKFISEPHWHYWAGFEQIDGPVRLHGYWQSPRYFAAVADTIRADFAFPPWPSEVSRDVAAHITAARNPVAVHVRRGDYVSEPKVANIHGGCCPPEYYARGIDTLAAQHGALDLFVFSDDADWLRSSFDCRGHAAVIVDIPSHRGAPLHDIHLMSLAAHHVIANSSFSWWGAWLSGAKGTVIAPRRWFNVNPPGVIRTDDHLPETWLPL